MGAKKGKPAGTKSTGACPTPPPGRKQSELQAKAAQPAPSKLIGWRLWTLRAGLLVFTPLLFAGLIEAGLRLCGYGAPATFLVRSPSGEAYSTNEKFARRYFGNETVLRPFAFTIPQHKPPGTVRICVLGESAAMGTPDPAFGFGRILELQLRHLYPDKNIEVLNAAMRGINSYVMRTIAAECARHEIDAFVIYAGNNEVVGLHAPAPGSWPMAQWLPLLRLGDRLRATRLGQFLFSLGHRPGAPAEKQDMAFFRAHRLAADEARRAKVIENFRANLEDVCRTAERAGAKVVLSTVAVNLVDCPPLASLHRNGLNEADKTRWEALVEEGAALEANRQYREALAKYTAAANVLSGPT